MSMHTQSRGRLHLNTSDSEHQQGIIRLAITAIFIVYVAGITFFGDSNSLHLSAVIFILTVEGTVGLLILISMMINPGLSSPRRWIGMVLDYSMMAATMFFLGEPAAPMYVVLLWVTVGNGLRYGRNFLYAAIVLAATSFLIVINTTSFWHAHDFLSYGLLLG